MAVVGWNFSGGKSVRGKNFTNRKKMIASQALRD
jgi:hypothetical protein